jgi:hypothetical protein
MSRLLSTEQSFVVAGAAIALFFVYQVVLALRSTPTKPKSLEISEVSFHLSGIT